MATETATFADSRAILIGVSAYEYAEFPPIRAARNSLFAMRDLLADPTLCAWPPERITLIPNPISAADLGAQVADLAEETTGVLLLYYVGHGVLTSRGELCLSVTSTMPRHAKISGLPWETVAEILRTCPASVRLAILDCCFAGQAIEALSSDSNPGLADIAHIDGVYTLTATTRNRTAHVPPPELQENACTSFTGELRDLIRSGITGGPPRLTFSDIFPVLRQRLTAKGLPAPSQRGTNTAQQFPLTANATGRVQSQPDNLDNQLSPTPPIEQIDLQLERIDLQHAIQLLGDAERVARSITNGWQQQTLALVEVAEVLSVPAPGRASRLIDEAEHNILLAIANSPSPSDKVSSRTALGRLAEVVAASDPDRAVQLAAQIKNDRHGTSALARLTGIVGARNPDQAEQIAQFIRDRSSRRSVLARLAEVVATSDPDRAERISRGITDEESQAWALASVAELVAASDPNRAAHLIADAGLVDPPVLDQSEAWPLAIAEVEGVSIPEDSFLFVGTRALDYPVPEKVSRKWPLAKITEAVAASGPNRAAQLIADAEDAARGRQSAASRAWALARIAEAVAASDANRAAQLIADAEDAAQSIAESWRPGNKKSRIAVLTRLARVTADLDSERAERTAGSITSKWWRNLALSKVAGVVAVSNPAQAERIVGSLTSEWWRNLTLGKIAEEVAACDPDRAERAARGIKNPEWQLVLLERIAKVVAASDPDRAERIARSITIKSKGEAILEQIAEVMAASDPDRAERIARSVTDESIEAATLGKVAEVVAASDPGRAERIARSITDEQSRASTVMRATNAAYREPTVVEQAKGSALRKVAEAFAASDPDRAERIVGSISYRPQKVSALTHLAKHQLEGWT